MKKIFSILAVALVLTACGSKKVATSDTTYQKSTTTTETVGKTTTANTTSTHFTQIANSFGGWQWVKIGGSISVSGGMSLSSSMQMKMQRGKSIYISIRPMGVIEVAKLIVTGDTLILIDKYHKRYLCENVKLITNGVPADVNTLQDIFLGRAFLLGKGTLNSSMSSQVNLANVDGTYVVTPKTQQQQFYYDFQFDSTHKILSLEVKPVNAEKNANVNSIYSVKYSDVKTSVAGNVASKVQVDTKFKSSDFGLKLEYSSFTWNEEQTIDTTIPKNYTRMSGASLLNMLGE